MELKKLIEDLRREKESVDRAIASLEELQNVTTSGTVPLKSKRGRKFMSEAERQEVSRRMKEYWSGRRKRQAK